MAPHVQRLGRASAVAWGGLALLLAGVAALGGCGAGRQGGAPLGGPASARSIEAALEVPPGPGPDGAPPPAAGETSAAADSTGAAGGATAPIASPSAAAAADSASAAPAQASAARRPAAGSPPTIESSARAFTERADEPWRIDGERLSGQVEGSLEIDRVQIRHAGLLIIADRGLVNPEERRAELHGNVVIRDTLREMTGDQAFYYRERALLEMEGHVRGSGPEGRFNSAWLSYDRPMQRLRLSGSVHLEEPGRDLAAGWLNHDMVDSLVTAGGGVQIVETADSVEVLGDLLTYDRRSGRATVVSEGGRRPRLTRFFSDGPPFEVEADTLELWSGTQRGESRGEVLFKRGAVRGTCREVVFLMEQNRVLLLGSPRVDDPDGWVAGDSMAVDLHQGRADRLVVWNRSRAEYFPPGRPGEAHFAVGDSLIALMEGGAIRSVLIEGHAQALYLPAASDREEGVGANWTRAQRLRLVMGAATVARVQFEGETSGRYVLPAPAGRRPADGDTTKADGLSSALLASVRRMEAAGDLTPPDSLLAGEGFDPGEIVDYAGERIDFEVATERITIAEKGQVTYHGMVLNAHEIIFDSARDLVRARGAPVLKDTGSEVHGEEMTYRLDSRTGLVFQGRSQFEGGYYRGERVKRIDEKTYYGQDVDFTSCEDEVSHYHFHAKRMRITPGEKALGGPVVMYIGNVPILAIPYAIFPIRSGRHSGILIPNFELGFDSRRGRYLKNIGYYYAPSDYWDTVAWIDYVESTPSITYWNRTRYQLRYVLSGSFQASFARENRDSGRRDRWSVRANHDQTLGDRFTLKASASFQSDKSYFEDQEFGASVDELLNRQLRSSLGLSKSWAGASLSLSADRTENLDRSTTSTRVTQTAPSLSLNFSQFPLGEKPNERGAGGRWPLLASMYLSPSVRYLATYSDPWTGESADNQAAEIRASLSDRRRLLGAVNLTPSLSANGAWAARDRRGHRNPAGANWRAGVSGSTTIYGTFFPGLGPLQGVRHVADLSASYSYSPENKGVKDFPSVGGIGLSSSKASSVSLSMTQRLHLKLRAGETSRKVENVLTWNSSTSYNFLAQPGVFPWSSMSHTLRLKPGGPFSSDIGLTHDLETWTRSRLTINSNLSLTFGRGGRGSAATAEPSPVTGGFGSTGGISIGPQETLPSQAASGPWSVGLTHTFSVGKAWDSNRSTLNLSTSLNPTRKWSLRWAVYFDLTEHEVTSQSYTLTRDLHCWHLSFDHQMRGDRTTYRLLINVKDLPDIKYERRRS